MKSKSKIRLKDRLLAIALSLVMVLGLIPLPTMNVDAATAEHPEVVTITVKNKENLPVSGAKVTYSIVTATGEIYVNNTEVNTDYKGTVEVINKASFKEGMKITATVEKEWYVTDDTSIKDMPIETSTTDIAVELKDELTINGIKKTYKESAPGVAEEYDAIELSAVEGYTVKYEEKDNVGNYTEIAKPTISNAGKYFYRVTVTKEGYSSDLVKDIEAEIIKARINDVAITGVTKDFVEGVDQELLTVEGVRDTDTKEYSLDGIVTNTIPKANAAGTYNVTTTIKRDNFEDYTVDTTSNIDSIAISEVKFVLNDKENVYKEGTSFPIISDIKGLKEGDKLSYKFAGETEYKDFTLAAIPTVSDAGRHEFNIKVYRNANYKELISNTLSVKVEAATEKLEYVKDELNGNNSINYTFVQGKNNTIDFALNNVQHATDIKYSVENVDTDSEENINDIATIDSNGMLTILKPGYILKVVTKTTGATNYKDQTLEFNVVVPNPETDLIKFNSAEVSVNINKDVKILSDQSANKKALGDRGAIRYSIIDGGQTVYPADYGLEIKKSEIKVIDYGMLVNKIAEVGNTLNITINAHKDSNKFLGHELHKESDAQYNLQLKLTDVVEPKFTVDGTLSEDGWYSKATVNAPEGYTLTKNINKKGNNFTTSIEYNVDDIQGQMDRIVYLVDAAGNISVPVTVTELPKLDSVKPGEVTVKYSEPTFFEKVFKFYKDKVKVTFTAKDDVSGIKKFVWSYKRADKVSESIAAKLNGSTKEVTKTENDGEYTATVIIPEDVATQLRGNLTVHAVDKADNVGNDTTDNGTVIIYDNISPTEKVSHEGTSKKVDGVFYYQEDAKFTFEIKEDNFFNEDVLVYVQKDNEDKKLQPSKSLNWKNTPVTDGQDLHVAELVLDKDGEYVVTMAYRNKMAYNYDNPLNNEKINFVQDQEYEIYKSEKIVVDKTAPIVEVAYSNGNKTSADTTDKQELTIKVTDTNFDPDSVVITSKENPHYIDGSAVTVKDFKEILSGKTWTQEGNTHTLILTSGVGGDLVDAIYNLDVNAVDYANNPASTANTGDFTVDHTEPELLKIDYSTSALQEILSKIHFYNGDVEVTFTAKDKVSGVKAFTWSYWKEDGASTKNVESYINNEITDFTQDGDIFTAKVNIPLKDIKDAQLRGSIFFKATDNYSNTNENMFGDDRVLVVDTIKPGLTEKYQDAIREIDGKKYYNSDFTITFDIDEANFYADKVKLSLQKDNGEFVEITPDKWVDGANDIHTAIYTIKALEDHSNDGDYVFKVEATDRSNNAMDAFTSNVITIDTIKPVIDVKYQNTNVIKTLKDLDNNDRNYYDDVQTAEITITEHNFISDEVNFDITAVDATGSKVDVDTLITKSAWKDLENDKHVITVTYAGDSNYTFDIDYTDIASNKAEDYVKDYITVDTVSPSNLTVSYENSILDTILNTITFGFYNAKTTVTINAKDEVSGVSEFKYDYKLADGVSSVNAELLNAAIGESEIVYTNGRKNATTTFKIPREALGNSNQFNGTVSFEVTDRSNNLSQKFNDTKRIVVDNISPTCDVAYSPAVQTVDGIAYYDGNINATVTVNEANFYASDVAVSVTKDGASYPVSPSWTDNSTDVHVGTFALSEDGDYFVSIEYTDKSSNSMSSYKSEQMTVDTQINAPVITVNGEEANGKAYKDQVVPGISFEDKNLADYQVKLTRTRFDEQNVDVTEKFMSAGVSVDGQTGSGSYDTFAKTADIDGIYTLTVSMTDKAGHSSETTSTFTVNRFGSVYEYGSYLMSLIKDGGAYTQKIAENLVITEYNADRLVADSLNIEISRDGKPIENVKYTTSPEINETVSVGSSGWFQYKYDIAASNFEKDGVYKISVSSKDATGNNPETTNYKDKEILFRVDSTAPEINSITGLEENIINAQDVTVKYNIFDAIALSSVKVYVDDKEVDSIDKFDKDNNNFEGSFTLKEKNASQKVRLVVEDKAGNITDTSADGFESAFAFNDTVTVSTNAFVRFYANKPLFFGSIAVVAVAGAIIIILLYKRREKEEA